MSLSVAPIHILLVALVSAVGLFAWMDDQQRWVAGPGFACTLLVLWLYVTLNRRDRGRVPLFDVGMFCAALTLVYSVYPLMNYWAGGFDFGIFGDTRLNQYHPTPYDIGTFHLRHVLYLFSFVASYAAFRGRGVMEMGNVKSPDRATMQLVILSFVLMTAFFFVLQLTTGITFSNSYEGDSIENKMKAFASAPLILVQISGKLAGILFVLKLALLCVLISRCRERKWLVVLLVWVAAEVIQALVLKGARGGLMMFLLATLLLYHRIVRPLSARTIFTLGMTLFVFFMFLGIYRAYTNLTSLTSDYSEAGVLSGPNEFQAMLGTAYDVYQRKMAGTELPWYLQINDVMNVLPPQQIVPFEKVVASEWYLREIGLSGTGHGYMWGVISQSVVGMDWVELALRGSILGLILAKIHRWYLKRQTGFFPTLLYMYLCLNIYYTFRSTTGSILQFIVWEILPVYFLLRLATVVAVCSRRTEAPALGLNDVPARN